MTLIKRGFSGSPFCLSLPWGRQKGLNAANNFIFAERCVKLISIMTAFPTPRSRFLRLFPALCFAALIIALSLVSNPPAPPEILSWDKFQHAVAYGMQALLLGVGLRGLIRSYRWRWLFAVCVSAALGALVELLQLFLTTERMAEWGDIVANIFGCLAAWAASAAFRRSHQPADPSP